MSQDYNTEFNPVFGWMVDDQLKFLEKTASRFETILEMGAWKGRLTYQLLKTGKKIYVVDTFLGSPLEESERAAQGVDIYKIFRENVGFPDNLEVFRMDSLDAAKLFPDKSIDMVFLDGTHTYDQIKMDIRAWLPKTKKMISGHDYYWPGVKKGIHEMLGGNIELFDGIWYKEL